MRRYVEVWFQRATDVVRKLISGDVDIGIVGKGGVRGCWSLAYKLHRVHFIAACSLIIACLLYSSLLLDLEDRFGGV